MFAAVAAFVQPYSRSADYTLRVLVPPSLLGAFTVPDLTVQQWLAVVSFVGSVAWFFFNRIADHGKRMGKLDTLAQGVTKLNEDLTEFREDTAERFDAIAEKTDERLDRQDDRIGAVAESLHTHKTEQRTRVGEIEKKLAVIEDRNGRKP